jgi:hypothetical protein
VSSLSTVPFELEIPSLSGMARKNGDVGSFDEGNLRLKFPEFRVGIG